MKLAYIAGLLVLATSSAFSQSTAWKPVPSSMPPTVVIQQQPDYAGNVSNGIARMADAINQYGATRSSTPAPEATLKPIITYERKPDGTMTRCRTYGENSFCD